MDHAHINEIMMDKCLSESPEDGIRGALEVKVTILIIIGRLF